MIHENAIAIENTQFPLFKFQNKLEVIYLKHVMDKYEILIYSCEKN